MKRPELPSAHRVVAFVDVVDSVGLYRRIGDEAAQTRMDEALGFAAACAVEGGGHCIKRNGDELLLLFPNADETCQALRAIQIDTIARAAYRRARRRADTQTRRRVRRYREHRSAPDRDRAG